ncbi:VCBS repeat-containing protein [Glaciecola sp. KUL10]|uniref:FG-GAP repeat domain-containing protein n=1 Tax=Glaciecola sp. (strain KUL10) TaxID=2161813 RepID=UPI000D7887B9|nr:VCBS repeat-containing protein [Glaciecola sp. KUL10]GBL05779.1 YD repeat protein [Glaciecola sp. KUL10]
MDIQRAARLVTSLCLLVLAPQAFSDDALFQYDFETHSLYYADVDGDGGTDMFLHALVEGEPSLWVKGSAGNNQLIHKAADAQQLPLLIEGESWHEGVAQVFIGRLNDDAMIDVGVILPNSQQVFGLWGAATDALLSAQLLDVSTFTWDRNEGEYEYLAGDFNGDDLIDLLALSQSNKAHFVYHYSESSGFEQVQKIGKNKKLGSKKDLRFLMSDFNNDGKDDLFAIARSSGKKHFTAYANENGKFKEKDIEVLKDKFTPYTWLSDQYSTNVVDIDADGYNEILRMYNSPYAYDLEGNQFLLFEPEVPLDEPCKIVFYSVFKKVHGLYCPDGSVKLSQ